jgi:hypothetical protein
MTPSVHEPRVGVPPYSQLTARSPAPSNLAPTQPVEPPRSGGRDHGRLPTAGRLLPLLLTLVIVGAFAAALWWTA